MLVPEDVAFRFEFFSGALYHPSVVRSIDDIQLSIYKGNFVFVIIMINYLILHFEVFSGALYHP
jgi:hypothetical protein